MSRSWSTFLMIAFLIGGTAPPVRNETPSPAILPQHIAAARIKRLGDRLPPGAIARLGKRADPGHFTTVTWSPDGKMLASAGFVNAIRRLIGHLSHVQSLAWSPDGKLLASGSDDETIRLWNPGTGKETRRLSCAERDVSVVAWSPDGTMLASASRGKFIYLWDARTG